MAVRIAAAFGGGMGKTGDTCGAVTGALMVIGLKYGSADFRNTDAEIETYEIARTFIEKFRSRNKSTICRDLIGFDINSPNGNKKDKERIIMSKCPNYVRDAAEIIEEIL